MKKIEIFTDGACSGNPGKGGYGVILSYNGVKKELSEGFESTTNNRMELLAAIKGLEALKEPCKVTLYSDSKYLIDAINKAKPAALKGQFLKSVTLTSTMGPGVKINPAKL